MTQVIDVSNMKFGKLTVIKRNGHLRSLAAWDCMCECGNIVTRPGSRLIYFDKKGTTQSCGCFKIDRVRRMGFSNKIHGFSKGENKRLYDVWKQMIRRCDNPACKDYPAYGGRGISICEEWMNVAPFIDWCLSSGYKRGLTIERTDVNGNYNPSNCTWVENRMQSKNTRKNIKLTFSGKTMCMSDWSREVGIHVQTLLLRHRNGWDTETILTLKPRLGRNQCG